MGYSSHVPILSSSTGSQSGVSGCTDIVLVRIWCLKTPFSNQRIIILRSSSSSKTFIITQEQWWNSLILTYQRANCAHMCTHDVHVSSVVHESRTQRPKQRSIKTTLRPSPFLTGWHRFGDDLSSKDAFSTTKSIILSSSSSSNTFRSSQEQWINPLTLTYQWSNNARARVIHDSSVGDEVRYQRPGKGSFRRPINPILFLPVPHSNGDYLASKDAFFAPI